MQCPSNVLFAQQPKLLDQVRAKIQLKHYSIRTEQAYTDWIKRYILHFGKRHPQEMGRSGNGFIVARHSTSFQARRLGGQANSLWPLGAKNEAAVVEFPCVLCLWVQLNISGGSVGLHPTNQTYRVTCCSPFSLGCNFMQTGEQPLAPTFSRVGYAPRTIF